VIAAAQGECMRCCSDSWTWRDYRGCSECFIPESGTIEPPRNSGEGDAVNGPTPLDEEAHAPP